MITKNPDYCFLVFNNFISVFKPSQKLQLTNHSTPANLRKFERVKQHPNKNFRTMILKKSRANENHEIQNWLKSQN